MVDRSVSVKMRAEVGQYVSSMDQAAQATSKVGDAAAKSQQKTQQSQQQQQSQSRTFAQSLVQSARQNENAWSTVRNTMVGTGTAITALGAAVAATGISYNQLQQTSRAALTTLLGSAEAANAQMDKLDEFAKSSPFSKQVFIEAQQQLIGFGTAAEDVIPILDAVQNAVAATGGSNQDIKELVNVIAEVGATGKITAENLNEFGQRGVDAATIIGEQMGKTGAQIREEITAGTLDADVAIQALTVGMQERFDGAAEGVKNTFAGATDRVAAAWRDLSSAIMEPFVGTEGGGIFTSLLNGLADVMRVVEGLPGPVLAAGGALTGFVGVSLVAIPTIVELAGKYQDLLAAIAELASTSPKAAAAVGKISGALKILGTNLGTVAGILGALALASWLSDVTAEAMVADVSISQLSRDLQNMGSATADLGPAMKDLFSVGLGPFRSEVETTQDALDKFADTAELALGESLLNKLNRIGPGMGSSAMKQLEEETRQLDEAFAEMVEAGNAEQAATQMQRFMDAAAEQGVDVEKLAEYFPQYIAAVQESGAAAGDAAGGQDTLTAAIEASENALSEWATAVAEVDASFIDLMGAYDTVIEKNKEVAQSTADASKSSEDSWEDFYDGATVKLNDWLNELEKQVEAQENWEQNMIELSGRVSQGVLDELARLGPEGAPLVQELVDATPGQLERLEEYFGQAGEDATGAFATTLEQAGPVMAAAAEQLGQETADEIAAKLASGELTIQEAIDQYDLDMEVDADTEPAEARVGSLAEEIAAMDPEDIAIGADTSLAATMINGFLVGIDDETGTVTINGDAQPANQTLSQLLDQIGLSTEDVTIDGDPIPANMTLADLLNHINNSEEDVVIGGDNVQGKQALESLLRQIGYSEEKVKIGGDTSRGQSSLNSFQGQVDNTSADINVDALTGNAEAAINTTARDRNTTIWVNWAGEKAPPGMAMGGPVEAHAYGGPIRGPGTGTSDSIVASGPRGPGKYRLSNGEHVWTDREVRSVGGHGNVMALRRMAATGELRSVLGFAEGGPISPYGLTPAAAAPVTVQPKVVATATLSSEDRALLASVAVSTRRLEVNGRVFAEIVDETNRRFGGKGTL